MLAELAVSALAQTWDRSAVHLRDNSLVRVRLSSSGRPTNVGSSSLKQTKTLCPGVPET